MVCEVDNEGRCRKHPFVQIKRRGRSGDWKVLLDSCPLCVIDDNKSVNSNQSSEDRRRSESALVPVSTKNQNWDLVTSQRHSFNSPKVKFAQEPIRKDRQFTNHDDSYARPSFGSRRSSCESAPEDKSVASGRYSTCGASVVSACSTVASARSARSAPGTSTQLRASALKSLPKYKACPSKMQQQRNSVKAEPTMSMDLDIDDESEDEQQEKSHGSSPPKEAQQPKEDHDSKEQHNEVKKTSRNHHHRHRSKSSSNSGHHSRPDPEEVTRPSHKKSLPPPPPPPPTRRLSPSHGSKLTGGLVVTRDIRDDDEVSAISFQSFHRPGDSSMGDLAGSQGRGRLHRELQGFDRTKSYPENDEEDVISENSQEDQGINTNNYDSKGRCSVHPHIRLRKKKMLGRGWKVLMNACPDCCVDELRRIKLVESKRRHREREHRHPEQVVCSPKVTSPPPPTKGSDETASLSGSSGDSGDLSRRISMDQIIPTTHSSNSSKKREGIFVTSMQWTDDKGNKGSYTGEVDSRFIPQGSGFMQYENGTVKEGEWKNGGCKRCSSTSSRHSRSGSSIKSSSSSSKRSSGRHSTSVPKH